MALKPGTKTMNLKCGRYEANINGIDAEDFPRRARGGRRPSCPGGREDAPHGASARLRSPPRRTTRAPCCPACCVTIDGDELTMAAADGFRLAVRTVALAEPRHEKLSLLVPRAR